MRNTNKDTLIHLSIRDLTPTLAYLDQPGFHLESLMLSFFRLSPTNHLKYVTHILPHHPELEVLEIMTATHHQRIDQPVGLPKEFLEALPRGLMRLSIDMGIDSTTEELQEFLAKRRDAYLDSFEIKVRGEEGAEGPGEGSEECVWCELVDWHEVRCCLALAVEWSQPKWQR